MVRKDPHSPLPTTATPSYQYNRIKAYFVLIIIGIIILLVGGIVYVSNGFLDDPDDYDTKDSEEHKDNVRIFKIIGSLIQYIGLILL